MNGGPSPLFIFWLVFMVFLIVVLTLDPNTLG